MMNQDIEESLGTAQDTMLNLKVVKLRMPSSVKGASCRTPDNGYMVVVNYGLSAEEQEEAFLHEMLHVWNGDHDREDNIQELEARIHQKTADFVQK